MKTSATVLLLAGLSCVPSTPPNPPLGAGMSSSVFYQPGNGTMTAVIQFSDDVREDCTASDQHVNYGHLAVLSLFSGVDFVKGETMPWVTNAQAQGAMAPVAFFSIDQLSGLDLTTASGQVTLLRAPGDGNKTYELHLQSPDAGVDAMFTVPPLCP